MWVKGTRKVLATLITVLTFVVLSAESCDTKSGQPSGSGSSSDSSPTSKKPTTGVSLEIVQQAFKDARLPITSWIEDPGVCKKTSSCLRFAKASEISVVEFDHETAASEFVLAWANGPEGKHPAAGVGRFVLIFNSPKYAALAPYLDVMIALVNKHEPPKFGSG